VTETLRKTERGKSKRESKAFLSRRGKERLSESSKALKEGKKGGNQFGKG